jgi:N-hydroxyarylamine O-acetyltransferase
MSIGAYLDRLGVDGDLKPNLDTLRRLHASHLRTVPFENSSVLAGELIALDRPALVHKIAVERRGGFCYELNGAFGALLDAVGFTVHNLSARVFSGDEPGPPFDHLALRVPIDGEPWLVDVGFGYCFLEPLRLEVGLIQDDFTGRLRIDDAGVDGDGELDLLWDHGDGQFRPQYRFDRDHHELADFAEMCVYHSTSPDTIFTKGWLCSVATDRGGLTYFDGTLFSYEASGERTVGEIADPSERDEILQRRFGVTPGVHVAGSRDVSQS